MKRLSHLPSATPHLAASHLFLAEWAALVIVALILIVGVPCLITFITMLVSRVFGLSGLPVAVKRLIFVLAAAAVLITLLGYSTLSLIININPPPMPPHTPEVGPGEDATPTEVPTVVVQQPTDTPLPETPTPQPPSATPSPLPQTDTPVPSPTPDCQGTVISGERANIRVLPDIGAGVIGYAEPGSRHTIYTTGISSTGRIWYSISMGDGRIGWMRDDVLGVPTGCSYPRGLEIPSATPTIAPTETPLPDNTLAPVVIAVVPTYSFATNTPVPPTAETPVIVPTRPPVDGITATPTATLNPAGGDDDDSVTGLGHEDDDDSGGADGVSVPTNTPTSSSTATWTPSPTAAIVVSPTSTTEPTSAPVNPDYADPVPYCPAGMSAVYTVSPRVVLTSDTRPEQYHYLSHEAYARPAKLFIWSMVGHPDLGCPDSGLPTCEIDQPNESFYVDVNYRQVGYVGDHGNHQWMKFEFDIALREGDNKLTFRHSREPGGPGSVDYVAVVCANPIQAVPTFTPTSTPTDEPTWTPVPPTATYTPTFEPTATDEPAEEPEAGIEQPTALPEVDNSPAGEVQTDDIPEVSTSYDQPEAEITEEAAGE